MKTKEQKQTMRQRRLAMRKVVFSTSFRLGILSIMAVFGLLNVVQITKISTTGYEMNDLEIEIAVLKQDNKQIEFHISTYRSMQSIQERLTESDMIRADKISYLTIPGRTVARR